MSDSLTPEATLVVTGGKTESLRQCKRLLRDAFPNTRLRDSGFRFVFLIESAGDPLVLADNVGRQHHSFIGHITPVLANIETSAGAILQTAVKIGTEYIEPDETVCFRIHKRGAHGLVEETPTLEKRIGSAIWEALEQKYGEEPLVDLKNPDVTVVAEVLGPRTAIGITRKAWKEQKVEASERRVS